MGEHMEAMTVRCMGSMYELAGALDRSRGRPEGV